MAEFLSTTHCPECGSNRLKWHGHQQNTSGVVDGKLCMHDISTVFFLGCEVCSETLKVVHGETVADFLTKSIGYISPNAGPTMDANNKGKIYLGKKAFEALKAHLGILYGSEFKYQDVLFICVDHLEPLSMVTLDPVLSKIIEELENSMDVKQ